MPVRRPQPPRFEFIDENETLEGKRDMASNQRLVRAHVMRDVRKKQKAIKKPSSLPGAVTQRLRNLECPHSSTTEVVIGRSSSSSGCSSDFRSLSPPDVNNPDRSPSAPSRTSVTDSSPQSQSQIVFKVCSQCWTPLQTLDPFPSQNSDSDKCLIDHDHWSGLILPKRRSEPPLFKGWLSLADEFSAAGVGAALGPDLRSTFPQFFRQFTIFNSGLYPLEPLEIQSMCAKAAVTDGESAMLHALCFIGAMHLVASKNSSFFGNESLDQRVLQAAMLHKSKALSLMNGLLADPDQAITESSIITVSLFAALEGIGGDTASAEIHSRGLARMVELRGGLSALSPNVIGDIYTSDTKTAAVGLSKPFFPLTEYWKQRIDQLDFTPGLVSPSLATRFFDPDLIQIFHPQILRTFRFIRHLINYTEYAKRKKGSQPLPGYTSGEFAVAEHLLLSFPYEGHPINTTNDQVQECTRIATLLYCNLALWTCPSYFALVKSLVINLRQATLKLDFSLCGRIYPDLMLWILFMGCFAAEGRAERSWFIIFVADIAKSLGLRQWAEVKRLLVKFFYVERTLKAPFVKIWDELFLILDDS